MRALGIIGTLLVVGGAVLCIGGVVRWRRAADLAARGEVAEGDVVGATEVRGGRGSRSYRLAVEFPAGGKRYRKSFVVSKATFDARAAGVRVQYLAEDPARSRVDEGRPRPGEEVGMGAVLTVSGTRYDLVVKYLGATVGLALLPDPGGDRFVVEVSGVHDGEGEPVPAFAYLVSCEKLLLRNSATFDEEDGWWTAADLPLRARRTP